MRASSDAPSPAHGGSHCRFEQLYLPMQLITTFLFVEFLIRVTIGIMAGAMMVMTNAGITGIVPLTICVMSMLLLWMESVLGLCVGCEIHGLMVRLGWVQKDSAFEICAHGACEVPPR